MALYIVKPWYKKQAAPALIYGAEWAGGSDPSWTRTDDAVGFSAPNPYYSGMSTTPSSPFDYIMPWSGMRRVTDSSAGELVEIPKFYYKWTRDGAKMKLQISMEQYTGFLCSPAHADRGDGIGERDYVYIARYQCASDYISKTGVLPVKKITRSTARSSIHALGSYVWLWDFATYWTICMLYLVEYANWNSQNKIGFGWGNGSSIENNGASDTMPYHTGTMKTARNMAGVGIQYRHIENLWANTLSLIDGIYFNGSNVYAIKNPNNFSDTTGGTLVGQRAANDGVARAMFNSTVSGYEYAIYPSSASGTNNLTYVCDYYNYSSSGVALLQGAPYNGDEGYGLFYFNGNVTASGAWDGGGARLMVLPPSRLT